MSLKILTQVRSPKGNSLYKNVVLYTDC